MTIAAQYHITTESIMLSKNEQKTISGMTGFEFQQKLMDIIKTDPANTGGFPEAPLAYDAVWLALFSFILITLSGEVNQFYLLILMH